MEEVLCDISAFNFYRTPPAVLALFDALPIARDQATRQALAKQPLAQHVLGAPLHFLVDSRNKLNSAKTIKRHLWTGELPQEAIREIEGVGTFTSPEMTLFLMARWMTPARLALAMYEFCGSFTVYNMSPELAQQIKRSGTERLNSHFGWRQVYDYKGRPTDLWSRPPLVTLEQLQAFAQVNKSRRGGAIFSKAVQMVAGMTRSPLEAEAALLLCASRRRGGYGYALETNRPIPLTRTARKIYPHDYCEADIYIESPDGHHIVDVECQGAAIHAGERAHVTDANRTTALESMGINVVQITYADIHSPDRLELISQHIDSRLGISRLPRNTAMHDAEKLLRKNLACAWDKPIRPRANRRC